MTWDELRALAERGVEIGSHTLTHPHLPLLSDEELLRELGDSREQFEAELNRPCRYLAYPYGENDDAFGLRRGQPVTTRRSRCDGMRTRATRLRFPASTSTGRTISSGQR